jgi:hypothetical protein
MNVEIPESELMAEKLGMIVLCQNCGKRLEYKISLRIKVWSHIDTNLQSCTETYAFGMFANPRNFEMWPQ